MNRSSGAAAFSAMKFSEVSLSILSTDERTYFLFMQQTFQQAFCEYYGCKEEDFIVMACFRCFDRRSLLLFCLGAFFTEIDIEEPCRFIHHAGETRDSDSLKQLIGGLDRSVGRRKGFLTVMVSGEHVLRVNAIIRGEQERNSFLRNENGIISKIMNYLSLIGKGLY